MIVDHNFHESDPGDREKAVPGESNTSYLPPKGAYTFRTTAVPEARATREHYLMMTFPAFEIVKPGDPADGHEVKFTNLSVKKWPTRAGSPLGDYLKAHGIEGQTTYAEYVMASLATVGREAEGGLDWRGYCRQCGYDTQEDKGEKLPGRGMGKFPKLPDGSHQPWIDCPNGCQDHSDSARPRVLRLWARTVVVEFFAPTEAVKMQRLLWPSD